MARIDFAAPIIRAALASLEANLPAHVAVFNAEPANEVALEVPVEYVFGATDVMVAYPLVEANVVVGRIGPFAVGGEAGPPEADHDPILNVIVWTLGVTGEVPAMYEAALGYIRVVVEILTRDGALGVNAEVSGGEEAITYDVNVIPADPAGTDRELRKWRVPAAVAFRVEAVERWQ